jgi:D-3-phosphoglycerate dehydrogenase
MSTLRIPSPSTPVIIEGPLKVLLLENIHVSAEEMLEAEGFSVERLKGAFKPEELEERIQGIHLLGLRS